MAENGVQTTDFPEVTQIDDVIGNYSGTTVRFGIGGLISLIGSRIGPSYQTRAELYADLVWPAGAIGAVYGDTVETRIGVYKKSGASGAGTWSRIGDLPVSQATVAMLALKADKTALAAETALRIAALAAETDLRIAGDADSNALIGALSQGFRQPLTWDPATGTFPADALAGSLYRVIGTGTVDGVSFVLGNTLVASTDAASTTTYAGNWLKGDFAELLAAMSLQPFKTLAEMTTSSSLLVGQRAQVAGQGEFVIVAAGTYTANGTSVIDLSGIAGQAVSASLSQEIPFFDDTRPIAFLQSVFGSSATLTVTYAGHQYRLDLTQAASPHVVTAGGAELRVVPNGNGYETGAFGHIGTGLDEHAPVQLALDAAESDSVGTVIMSAPLFLGATVEIPSFTTLANPHGYVTTMLPGCGIAYRNKIADANPAAEFVGMTDAIVDANNLADAWEGFRGEGVYDLNLIRPTFRNFTAISDGVTAGSGHLGNDGGDPVYAGYSDACGIVLTAYVTSGGAFARCPRWLVEDPVFSDCNRFMLVTSVPSDAGADGPGFGQLVRPYGRECRQIGVDIRFGEGSGIDMGRLQTSNPLCPALVHVGDTVTTAINLGTDGIMFTAYVRLADMTAGQTITQISVDGDNLLSAPVPFNTSMKQTVTDLLAACNAGPSSYTFKKSARRPALWIYASDGSKLLTATTNVVVTTNATAIVASGPAADTANIDYRAAAVTGLTDKYGNPEGHEGSDCIGILITDRAGLAAIEPGGNGVINRLWWAPSVADLDGEPTAGHLRTNIMRGGNDMTRFGGGVYVNKNLVVGGDIIAGQMGLTTHDATGLTVEPVTPNDWSVVYNSRVFQTARFGAMDYVHLYIDFTPTFSTATGQIKFKFPSAWKVIPLAGLHMMLDVPLIKCAVKPNGEFGVGFRVLGNTDYGQVVVPAISGATAVLSTTHLATGVNAQLRVTGYIPGARP